MDKKERGIYGGIGTGAFGIIMGIVAWNTGISNLTGQIEGAIGAIFLVISIASFINPESMGQIAMEILKNQQRAIMGANPPQNKEQSTKITGDINAPVFSNIDAENANFNITNVHEVKPKTDDEMTYLVAPLYAKSRERNKKRYFMKGSPGYLNSAQKRDKEYFEFWEKIETHQHLGIKYLRDALEEYQKNKSEQIGEMPDPNYEKSEKQLFERIEQRYNELIK